MKTTKAIQYLGALLLWLAGLGLAAAQSNSIEAFDVTQEGGKVVVRIRVRFLQHGQLARPRQPGH